MTLNAMDAGSLAVDVQNLDKLKLQAKQAPEQALRAAAKQFEMVFLNMMLKSMREATPQDGMFDNEQTKMFTGMLDQQLSQNISSGRGIGLAEIMVRQLSSTLPNKAAPSSLTKATNPVETTHSNTKTQSAIPAMTKTMSSQDGVSAPYKLSVHQDFVQRMLPHAQRASRDSGIPAHLILGQAALESGWGKHAIKTADGSDSYNLFGIKAGNHWNGKVAEVTTTEYRNGVAFEMVDKFRVYSSHEEAFKDYTRLLSQSPRYAAVLQQDNAQGFAQALQKSGYATDPRYAEKLTSVIGRINTVA